MEKVKAGWRILLREEKGYGYFKPSDEVMEAWQRTKEIAQTVRARIILFQCPASFVASGEWSQEAIISLCQELNLIHCTNPLEMMPLYGAINYLRLHGSPGYRHRYTDEELEQLRQIIGDKESYILFNNITMYDDGLRFIKLLQGESG